MPRDLRERDGLPLADQKSLSNIETHGWVVTKVFRSAGETGLDFAYFAWPVFELQAPGGYYSWPRPRRHAQTHQQHWRLR